MTTPSYTCPVCRSVSYNPNDVEQGYCGKCHDFTRLTGELVEVRPGLTMPDWLLFVLREAGDETFTAEDAARWLREVGFEFDPERHVVGATLARFTPSHRTDFRPGIRGSVAHPPEDHQ